MMKRKAAGILAFLFAVLPLCACGNDKSVLNSSKEESAAVMTANGFDVPYELYRYIALNYKNQYEGDAGESVWVGTSGQALLQDLNEHVEDSLKRLYTTIVLSEEYGIHLDDEIIVDTVDAEMDAIYESYEYDYKAYDADIAAYHMNDGVYRFLIRNDVLGEELFHAMLNRGEIETDEDVLRSLFESDEFIRVKQILVAADNGKTKEENRAKAEELYAMVQNGGDFETIVQDYGEDLLMFNNENGYYLMRGSFYHEFEDAAFKLEIGEVSGIVESEAGFSILKRYEKESDYLKEHFDDLTDTYYDSVYNLKLEECLRTVTLEPTEQLSDYTIFTME